MGGGGGSGGILTIVGLSRLPSDVIVDLNGKDGQAPGGGGGGAGAVRFVGREADTEDQVNGRSISAFLPVNAVSIDGLLNVLGAGWTYCPILKLPHYPRLTFVFVIEFGRISPSTLLHLEIVVKDLRGLVVGTSGVDVEVPESTSLVRRVPGFVRVQPTVESYGVYEVEINSGNIMLSSIQIELRQGGEIEN